MSRFKPAVCLRIWFSVSLINIGNRFIRLAAINDIVGEVRELVETNGLLTRHS